MRCPLRKRLASCAVCCTPFFSRASAASFCCAFGPAADAFPCRDDLNPPRSLPSSRIPPPASPLPLFFFAIAIPRPLLVVLFAARFPERLVGGDDRLRRFGGIVRHQHQIQIPVGDFPFGEHARLQPPQQSGPVIAAEEDHRKSVDLAGLDQRQRL